MLAPVPLVSTTEIVSCLSGLEQRIEKAHEKSDGIVFSNEVGKNGTGDRMVLFNIAGLTSLDSPVEPIGVVRDDHGSLTCLSLLLRRCRERLSDDCLLWTTGDR
jgi:hypothetical protein